MADIITTAPITASRPLLSSIKLPKIGLRAALVSLASGFGRAAEMAYVDPYRISGRGKPSAPEADLEGRDPNW